MKAAAETCPLCDNTGWKQLTREGGRAVVRCDCVTRARGERLLEMARIPRRYEHCELSNYEPRQGPFYNSQFKAKIAAAKLVEDYPLNDGVGLLLVGSVGVGKTHLAVGLMKELLASRGAHCLFHDYRELLKQIRDTYNESVDATEMQVLRPVFEAEVLVLDELGAVKSSEWVWETVSHVLNTRYNDKRTTIITTNYPDAPETAPLNGFAGERERAERAARKETLGDRIGERMRSRLHEMCRTVVIEGEDYRLTMKNANFPYR